MFVTPPAPRPELRRLSAVPLAMRIETEDIACQSFGRIHTFLLVVVLTLLSLFATLLHQAERYVHMDFSQRKIHFYQRQMPPSSITASNSSSSQSPTSSSIPFSTTQTAVVTPQIQSLSSSSSTGIYSSSVVSSSAPSSQTPSSVSTSS